MMRRFLVSCAVVVAVASFPAAALAEQIAITVKGMVCSFCAQGIKKTFSRKEPVKGVDVDLDKKIVTITTKEGRSLSDSELTEAIVDAGYEVVTITRSPDA